VMHKWKAPSKPQLEKPERSHIVSGGRPSRSALIVDSVRHRMELEQEWGRHD